MIKRGFLGAFCMIPAIAQGAAHDGVDFHYEEALGGVYTQGWSLYDTGADDGITRDVYVRGTGKSGDFWGILAVNCAEPQLSAWTATGGFLTADDVPAEAIAGARQILCSE